MEPRELLIALSLRYAGDWDRMMEAIRKHDYVTDEELCSVKEAMKTCGIVTIVDPEYPAIFKAIKKPPLVIYYQGKLSLVAEMSRSVAYVGSRKASPYGLKMAKTLCEDFAREGFSVISGLAYGIDTAAAEAALPFGKAVAVLGNGLLHYYPQENRTLQRQIREKGLLLSEYPPKCPPSAERFPPRNRIIAGLAIATVVGEASLRSGTLITVGFALDAGRDVLCVPYQADAMSACNLLIRDGACLIERASDLYHQIGYEKAHKA